MSAELHRRQIEFGAGAIDRLPAQVHASGAQRVLVVGGSRSLEASGAARIVPELEQYVEVLVWSEFSPNVSGEELGCALAALHGFGPELIVGIGGGTALDLAKLLAAFAATVPGAIEAAVRAAAPVATRSVGLILVPTTSGSGSEATHFAVVYLDGEKHSVAGVGLLPDRVILDPDLTRSGSAAQRATSGLDALSQAIESMWAVAGTARSRRFARHAVELVYPVLADFVHAPSADAASRMMVGSHLAGRAINISRTTAPHALSYRLTTDYGIPHGNAVALTLGAFLEAHDDVPADRLQPGLTLAAHRAHMAGIYEALDVPDGRAARQAVQGLLQTLPVADDLFAVVGNDPAALVAIVDGVNVPRLANNPVRFRAEELHEVVQQAAGLAVLPGGAPR